ncbi:MAG: hypothetical protein ACI8UO_003970 [Verrucomicrobiales bacterium]|jgi:hypothetical protein
MKRGKLEKHLTKRGCHFNYHDGNHDFWVNPKTRQAFPVRGTRRSTDLPRVAFATARRSRAEW